MAGKLLLEVVTPEKLLLSQEVDEVIAPGSEGEFGVSPNHAPVMSVIKPGALKVINEGAERRIYVNGGFADVTPEGLTVLAVEAVDLADVDPAQLEQQLKNAQEDLRDANTDEKRTAAQLRLSRLEIMRAAMTR